MPSFAFNGYYLTLALLLACTLIGIFVAARFTREVEDDLAPPTAKDLLDPLEKAYFSGLMHPAEIERVRESVKKAQLAEASAPKPPHPTKAAAERDASLWVADEAKPDLGSHSAQITDTGSDPD